MKYFDVIIVGSGIVGLSAALSLAKNCTLKIAVMDKTISSSHTRVSAISLGSQHFFCELGIWDAFVTSPYKKMFVWDANSKGEIEFNCKDVHQSALGYIVEDQLIKNALLKKISEKNNIKVLAPINLVSFAKKATGYQLNAHWHDSKGAIGSPTFCAKELDSITRNCDKKNIMQDNTSEQLSFNCNLIIAADGARSWVREQAGIKTTVTDYQHKAITATVQTELPHQQTAWQCFTPQGPLAFLPLQDPQQCSIVWSVENAYADQLIALNDEDFQNHLNSIFASKLGKITSIGPRVAFPLKMQHAEKYILPHLALVGDAAHTLHPLAGQGVNLGLQDAACLASVVLAALEKNRDYTGLVTLRKYERARKSENTIMLRSVDSLKSLFASKKPMIASMRGTGLYLVNKLSFLKNFFAYRAMNS